MKSPWLSRITPTFKGRLRSILRPRFMVLPLLLLLVLLALAGNYAYVLLSRRSRARVSLRGMVPLVRQRHALLSKLESEAHVGGLAADIAPGLIVDVLQASQACRGEISAQPDEGLVVADNAFAVQAEALFRKPGVLPSKWVTRWEALRQEFDVEAEQYNKLVRGFNDSLGRFPGNWLGRAMGLKALPPLRRG